MLDAATRHLVKATVPVLKEHGVTLTRHFYARMFAANPELKEVFNQGHQHGGSQQQALAGAVLAYAQHIDDPLVLLPVLERVAHKHVSLGVREEHYAIVGQHLLASISEVLGQEAATPELLAAWGAAYGQLAQILSHLEGKLYQQAASQPGGWTGWRSFRVARKTPESQEITSFELVPADGGSVPGYRPGQYISLRVLAPELGYRQPRQYSLSAAPGGSTLRISVKRETGAGVRPAGMVSNYLHDVVQQGDVLELAAPAGEFVLEESRPTPVVLISAGVGITPLLAMLEHLAATQPQRAVRWLHASRSAQVQAFAERVQTLLGQLSDAWAWVVHENPPTQPSAAPANALGRLDLQQLPQALPGEADYYVCGPRAFMAVQIQALKALGVPATRIHAEAFGTGGVSA